MALFRSRPGGLAALLVLAAIAWVGLSWKTSKRRETIVVTGSSTVAPLFAEIGKRFEALHPEVRVDVQTGGSSRGIADVRSGIAAIGMVSRALTPAEHDLHGFAIARDGIALIVHASNPVRALTDDEVRAIYTGRIRNWRLVGGKDAPITVVHKAHGRATLDRFLSYFQLEDTEVRPDVVIGDNEQGIKTVAGNPNALGYVSIGTAAHDIAQGVPLRMLETGGVEPTLEALAAGRFPISRPLLLVTSAPPHGTVRRLIAFARSSAVEDLIRAQSFAPLPGNKDGDVETLR